MKPFPNPDCLGSVLRTNTKLEEENGPHRVVLGPAHSLCGVFMPTSTAQAHAVVIFLLNTY